MSGRVRDRRWSPSELPPHAFHTSQTASCAYLFDLDDDLARELDLCMRAVTRRAR